jgi:hypothetical protein
VSFLLSLRRKLTFPGALLISVLGAGVTNSVYADPEREPASPARTSQIYESIEALVDAFSKTSEEKVVMVGKVQGPDAEIIKKSLQEALLKKGIQRANTAAEMKALRKAYKKQGVDVYKNRELQKLLRASAKAKLTLEVESSCSEQINFRGLYEECTVWLRGLLPTTIAFAEHRTFKVYAPRPPKVASAYDDFRNFLFLLLAYAFGPPLLHRLDISFRRADGSWRSVLFLPFYLLGNRLVTFLAVISFIVVGPYFFERWVAPLPESVEDILRNMGIAFGGMLVLHIVGCIFVSMWRDTNRGQNYGGTFREIFVLHPNFWSREIEGRLSPRRRNSSTGLY